jgi:hypothetical protein
VTSVEENHRCISVVRNIWVFEDVRSECRQNGGPSRLPILRRTMFEVGTWRPRLSLGSKRNFSNSRASFTAPLRVWKSCDWYWCKYIY